MSQTNRVQLTGNAGFNPEIREIAPGRKVARFSLFTTEKFMSPQGEEVTDTQWHTIVAWGSNADTVERLVKKGVALQIEGRLVHRDYTAGNGDKRYVTEVVLSSLQVMNRS